MAFRLITYRFFKFKQDAPHQLFSEEVHEAVPGSPLELARAKREWGFAEAEGSDAEGSDTENPGGP